MKCINYIIEIVGIKRRNLSSTRPDTDIDAHKELLNLRPW